MKKLFMAATIAAFSSAAFAQFTEAWHATYNGEANGYDGAFAVATDKRGNTYITGQTTNPDTATDYITIKYSPTGTQLWKQYYKGGDPNSDGVDIAHAIAVDNDGNVYVTGESQIGPSNPYSYYGFATIKYDTNGVQKWVARVDYAATDCKAVDLAINANSDVFVTGTKTPLSGTSDYLTVRYDTNGNQQLGWPVAYDSGGGDEAVAIAVGPGDDVYVTGQSYNPPNGSDWRTNKYTGAGAFLWTETETGAGGYPFKDDLPTDIAVDTQSHVYVCGVFYDGATDANAGTVCYNGDGSHNWGPIHYSYLQGDGYDYASALAIEPDNIGKAVHVFVTGFADRGAITGHDYLTLRYPGVNALTHDYVNFYNTSGSVVDWSHDVSVTGNGSVYVTGQSGDDIATLRYDKQLVQQAVIRYTPGSTAEGRGIANTCAGKAHVAGLANNSGHYFDCETMIDQLSTSNFVPNSLTIEAGQNVVGNLSSVQASDDNRLTVEPGAVFFGYPVRVIVEGHSPLSSPNELCFELEASGSDLHLEQRVELYDWVSGSWAQMDLRGVTTADSVVYCAVPYDSTRFVQAGTGTVKARISFQQTGAVFTYPWTGKIDYCA